METLDKAQILAIVNGISQDDIFVCIEDAFVAYSDGTAQVPPVGHLAFDEPKGDVHIKYGYIKGDPYYVIKIASGFYDNPKMGLPSSNGMMLAFDAFTGRPMRLLQDEGYLTDLRTAYAGAVAAAHMGPEIVERIGIIGTGIQARFQLRALTAVTDCREVLVYGRSEAKLEAYKTEMEAEGFAVSITHSLADVPARCNLIVTTTPSITPLLQVDDIRPGTHITAMGSDSTGKQELAAEILGKAALVGADSLSQCSAHGEVHHALKAGLLDPEKLSEIGDIIADGFERGVDDITVADLTGIATQDIKIVSLVLEKALGA
jgi:ornithine cyclodeaminase